MAGLSPTGYREHKKKELERDRKEFGEQKAALRRCFQQLTLNSLFKQITVKLLDMSYVDRICDPSMEFLGKALSRHPKVIGRHIKAIEQIGLFRVERRKAKGKNLSNRYIINWDCKVWYLANHPDYHGPQGQTVMAKLHEIINKHTQTKLVAAKRHGTIYHQPAMEPYTPQQEVAEEPYGSPEQEPYPPHPGTVRFHKLPQERGHHGHGHVDVPEPQDLTTSHNQDLNDVQVRGGNAAAPHQYPLAGCEAAASQPPQSGDRVLRTCKLSEASDVQDVQDITIQPKRAVLTAQELKSIRAKIADYDPAEYEYD